MQPDLTTAVGSYLDAMHCKRATMVVAVSGGVDSVVLLNVLHKLAVSRHISLVVAHANHNLRGDESDADHMFVGALAAHMKLPFFSDNLDVMAHAEQSGKGIEASARELRYTFLQQCASDNHASFIAVGHTADDVAETMIMNLARGSGIDGMSSHRSHRVLTPTITLIRPMLSMQRADITEYAHLHHLAWREDESNADRHFLRNRIRQEIMPPMRAIFGSSVSLRIAESSEHLAQARTIVQESVREVFDKCVMNSGGSTSILLKPLTEMNPSLAAQVLRTSIRMATGHAASHHETARLIELVRAEPGGSASLARSFRAIRDRNEIVIARDVDEPQAKTVTLDGDGLYVADAFKLTIRTDSSEEVLLGDDRSVATIDAESVKGSMVWRSWTNGDRIVPFGMQESVLVSDILTNSKVPSSTKRTARVVSDDEGILWVCGLRQAERTRITRSTRTVITLKLDH